MRAIFICSPIDEVTWLKFAQTNGTAIGDISRFVSYQHRLASLRYSNECVNLVSEGEFNKYVIAIFSTQPLGTSSLNFILRDYRLGVPGLNIALAG